MTKAYASILLGLGFVCNTAGAEPAELSKVLSNLSVLCKGADQMLFSSIPGEYVSWSLMGEACDGFYIPGQGVLLLMRVAFPLVAPATPAEVPATTAETLPAPVVVQPAGLSGIPSVQQRIEEMNRRARLSVARAVYNMHGGRPYDASACEALRHVLAEVLSNYVELLEVIPEGETVTVLVRGPRAAVLREELSVRDVTQPFSMQPVVPSGATAPAMQFSIRLSSHRVTRPGGDVPEGQSTLAGTIPRGKICIDPAETIRHMKFTAY